MKLFSRSSCSLLSFSSTATVILIFFSLAFSISGCSKKKEEVVKKEVIRPVKIMTVSHTGSQDITREFPGKVRATQRVDLAFQVAGPLISLPAEEGQRVKKNQLLVSLNSDITESAVAEVKTGLELARTVYKKRQGLWEKNIGSEIQYLEAKTNKESLENKLKTLEAQLDMAKIKAPISGIVDEIFRKEGELAVPGVQLIQLVNLNKIYVNADVSEAYLAKINKDDMVEVTFPSYPELTIETKIHRTGHVVKTSNRTFLVRLLLDNKDEILKPNMVAMIKMKDFSAGAALVVPSIIIKNDLKGSYLYVTEKQEEGKLVARKTYVTPGMSEGSRTMIKEIKGNELKPGQQVIIKGYNLVKNGMEVEPENGKTGGQ